MRLPPGWYAVFESREIRPRRPLAAVRFGLDVVAWRDERGAVVLQEDRCPHRSARLSLGEVREGGIVCPFHAFRFGPDGTCRHIPELGHGADGLRVLTFLTREENGLVWAWWGPRASAEGTSPPWFENIDPRAATHVVRDEWPTHYTRAVENQLDYAHLPYVHRTTIGRFAKEGAPPPQMRLEDDRIHFAPGGGETYIEFRFPNLWQNRISPTFSLTLCFVPVDAERTALILRTHVSSVTARLPIVGRVFLGLSGVLNRIILDQDRRVVLSQRPLDAMRASDEVLVRSDAAIRFFRGWMNDRAWSFERSEAAGEAPTPSA